MKGEEADRKEISVFAGTTPMPLSQNGHGLLFAFFFICFCFGRAERCVTRQNSLQFYDRGSAHSEVGGGSQYREKRRSTGKNGEKEVGL